MIVDAYRLKSSIAMQFYKFKLDSSSTVPWSSTPFQCIYCRLQPSYDDFENIMLLEYFHIIYEITD